MALGQHKTYPRDALGRDLLAGPQTEHLIDDRGPMHRGIDSRQKYLEGPFFEFYRSLTAYKNALQGKNSTMVISPDSEFFDYLKSDIGLQ